MAAVTTNLPSMDKAAIILCSVSALAAESVLGMLNPDKVPRLRELMDMYRGSGELEELRESVFQEYSGIRSGIEDSQREYGFVGEGRDRQRVLQSALSAADDDGRHFEDDEDDATRKKQLGDFESGEDPTASLKEIEVATLVRALQNEHPRAVAIALHRMGAGKASEVIKKLDGEVRKNTFILMAKGLPENTGLIHRVVQAVVEMCAQREEDAASEESSENYYSELAEILHLIDREDRGRLLSALQEADEVAYQEIDACLYDFTDVLKIEERSLQKILAEIDLKIMATALYQAAPEIGEMVMANMSERVRTMLQEEVEFLGSVSAAKVDDARREIADIIRKHDKAETLVWKEVQE